MLNGILDDVSKTSRFQRSAADERAVHVRLAHQLFRVRGLDAAAILDADFFRGAFDRMMSAKLLASSEAPPTSAPSTSGWLINSFAFAGLTLPPYWMRTFFAVPSSKIFTSNPRMNACASCACCVVAVLPVPIAQTGS